MLQARYLLKVKAVWGEKSQFGGILREKSGPGAGIGVEAQKEHRRMASLLCRKQRISFLSKKGERTFRLLSGLGYCK